MRCSSDVSVGSTHNMDSRLYWFKILQQIQDGLVLVSPVLSSTVGGASMKHLSRGVLNIHTKIVLLPILQWGWFSVYSNHVNARDQFY